MRPAYVSASQLTLFLLCPLKYRFRYIDQLPPAFKSSALVLGSVVHGAIEWFHKAKTQGRVPSAEEVQSIADTEMETQALEEIRYRNGEGLESVRRMARTLAALYCHETSDRALRASELPFEVDLVHPDTGACPWITLRGWFDAVETDGTIIEIKTAARVPDAVALAQHLQLSAYSYAAKRIYGWRPKLRIDCLLKAKQPRFESIEVKRGETDDRRFLFQAAAIVQAIETETFFPNPGWICKDCAFRYTCPAWD